MPNLPTSPWTRGAPQRGFASVIWSTSVEWPPRCPAALDVFELSVGFNGAEAIGDANDDRVGLHDDQGRSPIRPRLGDQDPKQSIACAELRPPDRAPENRQLLTQRDVLEGRRRCVHYRVARTFAATRRARPAWLSCRPIELRINWRGSRSSSGDRHAQGFRNSPCTGEPGDCRQQMQEQDGQMAHRTSYQDRDTGEECSRIPKIRHSQRRPPSVSALQRLTRHFLHCEVG